MKQTIKKAISGLLTASMALTLSGAGLATSAFADTLQSVNVTLSNVNSGESSNHVISFIPKTATAIHKVKFQYRKNASLGVTPPEGFSGVGSTKGLIHVNNATGGDTKANWTMVNDGTSSSDYTFTATADVTPNAGQVFDFQLNGITNNVTEGGSGNDYCNRSAVDNGHYNSDSCFIYVTTYDASDVQIDLAATTYTVVRPITVTATVDPILIFTVVGTNSGTANDAREATVNSITTSATAITFGNLTVDTPKVAQQRLNVKTNANNGYKVYSKFVNANGTTSSTVMHGTQGSNKLDAFDNTGGAAATWSSPQTFGLATGTVANTKTGWVGMRTTDYSPLCAGGLGALTQFDNASYYGPPSISGSDSGNVVIDRPCPDNGTNTQYVTLKITANAYQPADAYTGTMVYNVVASY